MTPSKVSKAPVRVRVCAPSTTLPVPDRLVTDAPAVVPEMSKVPFTHGSSESAIEPVPIRARVAPASTRVRPVKVLVPESVSVPPETVRPPVPLMTPAKVVEPLVISRYWAPRLTPPPPDRVVMAAPPLVPEMSKVPLSTTSSEVATDPVPIRFSWAPALIVVSPV